MSQIQKEAETVNCEVVHQETPQDIIVRTESGQSYSLQTDLPDIKKGTHGKLIRQRGNNKFILSE